MRFSLTHRFYSVKSALTSNHWPTVALLLSAAFVSSSCQNRSENSPAAKLAEIEFLFAPDEPLLGEPNTFEVRVETTRGIFNKGGDLPPIGEVIRVGALPVVDGAIVSASLHRNRIDSSTKTHKCSADSAINLRAEVPASVQLKCLPIANADQSPGVRVFLKMANINAQITQLDPQTPFLGRDLRQPIQFASVSQDGRRLTLQADAQGLQVAFAGDFLWRYRGDDALVKLLNGEAIDLQQEAGSLLGVFGNSAKITATKNLRAWERDDGTIAMMLSVAIRNEPAEAPTLDLQAALLEEAPSSEFTVVSWNVENLFDQIDDDRNSGYGDFRIAPNQAGQVSNWGAPVEVDGKIMSWTDIKVAGIRRALLGIDPRGPAIIALTEIESRNSLEAVAASLSELGYKTVQFSDWHDDVAPTAIGMGLISKFPMLAWDLVKVTAPPVNGRPDTENPRPILKVVLDVQGHPLTVYVNHWKSKGGPESARIAYAEALQADIERLQADNPRADWIIMGDLNSDYNERVIILPKHNDSNGRTGINDVINAQGDELTVARNSTPNAKYNLHYELDRAARKSAWHTGFNWSTLDHMIVGPGVYDQSGISYVDNSFQIGHFKMPSLAFLFNEDGTTNRWRSTRNGNQTTHSIGGYSDHAPLFARFRVSSMQSSAILPLFRPGRPDASDAR